MDNWFARKAGKLALKEALGVIFLMSCGLAKLLPIFDDGYYKLDAVLYMLLFGLIYFAWDAAR